MCGIVAGVSYRNVAPILLQGLERLEYRGYDSCGIAVHSHGELIRARSTARVSELKHQVEQSQLSGLTGIAHTRWATHGSPVTDNAHPHFSFGLHSSQSKRAHVGVVHNGIIENFALLRSELEDKGYIFDSQTDTEVIAHLVDYYYQGDLFEAVQQTVKRLHGAFAIAIFCADEPHRVVGARQGSPLILGVGQGENFLASDAMAIAGITDQIVYFEDGDVIDVQTERYWVVNGKGASVQRKPRTVLAHTGAAELGPYRHYMQKEIFEQPQALADTLEGVMGITPSLFGDGAEKIFQGIDSILIIACGTSYYAGLTASYWFEEIARIPTRVEVASEYRYRTSVPNPKTLVITISQSGETADTLSALRHAQSLGMDKTLTVCNVPTSAMVRECKLAYITRAGVEIGVASTKAFTTQLAGLFLLTLTLAKVKGHLSEQEEEKCLTDMRTLPVMLQSVLALEPQILAWAEIFARKEHAIFLGRGLHYPIALEGALKLKEISYIHAEGYPAGELKHGPLALVAEEVPVVTVAPNDKLLEKLKSNMQEVRARGGELFVFADSGTQIQNETGLRAIHIPEHSAYLSPILHVVPLQLLAYHTACARGTDVDKPRNLAKSVTVE